MPTNAPTSNDRRRRRTTVREYSALLDAHRRDLGAHKHAAEAAGVSYNTALKAYRTGFGPNMPAISKVIRREMAEARAILGREPVRRVAEERALQRHAVENIDQRVADGRVVIAAQANVAAVLALSGTMLVRALQLARISTGCVEDPEWQPSPRELLDILRAISCINAQAVATCERASKMEERVLGDLGVTTPGRPAQEMTSDELVEQLLSAERTLNRLRRRAAMTAPDSDRVG